MKNEKPESQKFEKTLVRYEDCSMHEMDCDDCKHFIMVAASPDSGRCTGVKGAISPEGWCVRFDALPGHTAATERAEKEEHERPAGHSLTCPCKDCK